MEDSCAMSTHPAARSATDHPEVIAIGLEITLDPARRRYYSALVLALADAAMQNLLQKVTAAGANFPPAESESKDV
jgi:hypothetical protein